MPWACLSTEDISDEEALKLAREWTGIVGQDFVKEVTCKDSYTWDPSGEKVRHLWLELIYLQTTILKKITVWWPSISEGKELFLKILEGMGSK